MIQISKQIFSALFFLLLSSDGHTQRLKLKVFLHDSEVTHLNKIPALPRDAVVTFQLVGGEKGVEYSFSKVELYWMVFTKNKKEKKARVKQKFEKAVWQRLKDEQVLYPTCEAELNRPLTDENRIPDVIWNLPSKLRKKDLQYQQREYGKVNTQSKKKHDLCLHGIDYRGFASEPSFSFPISTFDTEDFTRVILQISEIQYKKVDGVVKTLTGQHFDFGESYELLRGY